MVVVPALIQCLPGAPLDAAGLVEGLGDGLARLVGLNPQAGI